MVLEVAVIMDPSPHDFLLALTTLNASRVDIEALAKTSPPGPDKEGRRGGGGRYSRKQLLSESAVIMC